ncbi:MAG: hypothetical protein ACK46X_21265, partial [Candidatus Sericytochromatia bacterium]
MRGTLSPLVALMLLASLTGCPPRDDGGGGGPVVPGAPGSELVGDQLAYAEAYTRAPWVVTHLGAGDWHQALRDVVYMQDRLVGLKRSEAVRARTRLAIAGLQPKTDELALLIQRRDPQAMPMAASLTHDFTRVAVELSDSGWIA